jgi:hypothetical protein
MGQVEVLNIIPFLQSQSDCFWVAPAVGGDTNSRRSKPEKFIYLLIFHS